MAISLLEQRLEPLEARVPILYPFGPSSFPPSMEFLEEEYGLDGMALAGRKLRRSHTWSGFAGRLQRRDFQLHSEGEEQEPQSPSQQPKLPLRCEARPVAGLGTHRGAAARDLSPEDMRRLPSNSSSDYGSSGSSDWASLLEEEEEFASRRSSLSTAPSTPTGGSSRARPDWSSKLGPDEAEGQQAQGQKRASRRKAQKKKAPPSPTTHTQIVTTVMVQNLARNTTRHRFIEALNALGFADLYDYVHVPTSFANGRNQGFAFVNFMDTEVAQRFASQFQASDGTKPEDKLWRVAPANVQGSQANSAAARSGKMARVRSNAHRPLLFEQSR